MSCPPFTSGPDYCERRFSLQPDHPFGPLLPSYGFDGPEFQKMLMGLTCLQGGAYYEQGVGVLDEGSLQPQVYADSVGLFELSGNYGS